jgi:hypothetical protein
LQMVRSSASDRGEQRITLDQMLCDEVFVGVRGALCGESLWLYEKDAGNL